MVLARGNRPRAVLKTKQQSTVFEPEESVGAKNPTGRGILGHRHARRRTVCLQQRALPHERASRLILGKIQSNSQENMYARASYNCFVIKFFENAN